MADNREALRRYFGADLHLGSLNVEIDPVPANLHRDLDRGTPLPAFIIPRHELCSMSDYLGNGQAWRAKLSSARIRQPHDCWVFRRVGSKVRSDVLEIVSILPLVKTYELEPGEQMDVVVLSGREGEST